MKVGKSQNKKGENRFQSDLDLIKYNLFINNLNGEKKGFTIQDIEDLLKRNGASRGIRSPIRILDYQQLIPDKKYLNNLKPIGRGGYGSVYLINDNGLDYALKIFSQKKGETKQDLIDNFYNECRSLLSVNHQSVLRIIGVAIDTSDENDYCFCHYTNYQQKGNLYDAIQNRQLFSDAQKQERFAKKIRLLDQIAEGIMAIHNAGLIHRDIKSLNILLDQNDSPKIADLGLAGESYLQKTTKHRGTLSWMAPELFDHKVYIQSDI